MNRIKQQIRGLLNKWRKYRLLKSVGKSDRDRIHFPSKIQIDWRNIALSEGVELSVGHECIIRGVLSLQKKEASLTIGERTFIGSNSIVVATDAVSIGNDVLISHECYITDTAGHSLIPEIRKKDIPNRWRNHKDWSVVESKRVVIHDESWVGPKCTILKGVTIGKGAVIAAGSVVTKDIPERVVAAGVPAKVIKQIEQI